MFHYFLGQKLLGSSNLYPKWSEDKPLQGSSAYFCSTCGEIWARIVNDKATYHQALIVACAKHGNGSFILPWRQGCPSELPPEVLLYEFNLRLNNPNRSKP